MKPHWRLAIARSSTPRRRNGGIRTVGFCSISTGVFGYPKDAGAGVAIRTIRDWLTNHPESRIEPLVSAFTPTDEAVYLDAITEVLT
ncbi:hypothetical protein NQ038_03355 [Brevibacterium sp. 50QC2O2]|nr:MULTISPECIES: hypothetical protein [unclassified Brevibacterium]MCQ9368897.1 hypothetical protein [Brevibacterium sp. 91QC2O2]MCQ9386030.1 hypothetical protein [Brevibacterium sp. 68QC2CO]MCQ9387679.1 hypothetical protein [Brevibacterium sp. 50QC2O2]